MDMEIELLFLFIGVLGTAVFVVFMVKEHRTTRGKETGKTEPQLKPIQLDETINALETDIEKIKTRMDHNEKQIGEFKVALDLEPPVKESKDNLRTLGERLDKVEDIVAKLAPKEPEQEKTPTEEQTGEKQGDSEK